MLYSGLDQHNSNLREHQIEAKGKIFDAWDRYDAVMLQMPTGTGKTYLFTSIVNDLLAAYKEAHRDIHILVVAPRMELLDQIWHCPWVYSRCQGATLVETGSSGKHHVLVD